MFNEPIDYRSDGIFDQRQAKEFNRYITSNQKKGVVLHNLLHNRCRFCSSSFGSSSCRNCCLPVSFIPFFVYFFLRFCRRIFGVLKSLCQFGYLLFFRFLFILARFRQLDLTNQRPWPLFSSFLFAFFFLLSFSLDSPQFLFASSLPCLPSPPPLNAITSLPSFFPNF